jgi:SulP family sulfate permease
VTVLIKIEYGVFAGIVVSMALFLNRASALRVHELLPHAQYRYIERGYTPGSLHARSDLVAVAVHGDLFFGLARQLREQLNEIAAAQEPRAIVLRVRRAYTIDYSCWNALFEFAAAFHERGGRLYLCGVRSDFRRIIQAAGMQAILPATQVFAYTAMPFKAFESALAAAFRDLPPAAVLSPEWSACQERVRCV